MASDYRGGATQAPPLLVTIKFKKFFKKRFILHCKLLITRKDAIELQKNFMIIRNRTNKETATRSSLDNRGYERSEHPRMTYNRDMHSGRVPHHSKRATPPGSIPMLAD